MKKRIYLSLLCGLISVSCLTAMTGCGNSATSEKVEVEASETIEDMEEEAAGDNDDENVVDATADENSELVGSWTAEIGEPYGAATQGDEETELTSLSLLFTEDGKAYNVVGDIMFDYVLKDDGSITVSNMQNETGINDPEFYMENGNLVMHARINGGNATITFEKEQSNKAMAYEFEDFDGNTVKIDDSNIISQEQVENVLETDLVPEEAEVIAPGRDYVYLADENYYYVEDAVNGLLTVAQKNN